MALSVPHQLLDRNRRMRKTSLYLLSILEISRGLACLAIESVEPPAQVITMLESLDDTRHFRPLFFPSTHPNTLLAVFSGSMAGSPTASLSVPGFASLSENLLGITIA